MKTSLLSLFAGTMFLAGAGGASAGEPVTLASAELDAISAGYQSASIDQDVIIPTTSPRMPMPITKSTTTISRGNVYATAVATNVSEIRNVTVARISQEN